LLVVLAGAAMLGALMVRYSVPLRRAGCAVTCAAPVALGQRQRGVLGACDGGHRSGCNSTRRRLAGTDRGCPGHGDGLAAGAVLGLVSGCFLPALDGPPTRNRVVLWLMRSPAHRALDGSLVAPQVRGAVTGRPFHFPVQYAGDGDSLVILPGHPETKRWWRNVSQPAHVDVLLRGT
jgi:hypothetical protein